MTFLAPARPLLAGAFYAKRRAALIAAAIEGTVPAVEAARNYVETVKTACAFTSTDLGLF